MTLPQLADWKLELREKRCEVRLLAEAGWGLETGQNMVTYERHCLYLAFKLFIDSMTFFLKHGIIFFIHFIFFKLTSPVTNT